MKTSWAVVTDQECDWLTTKKAAIGRARELKKEGAKYCYIEKHDGENFVGNITYIFDKAET